MYCPACGTLCTEDAAYCQRCGTSLRDKNLTDLSEETPPVSESHESDQTSDSLDNKIAPLPEAETMSTRASKDSQTSGLGVSIAGISLVALNLDLPGLICSIIGLTKSSRARKNNPDSVEARTAWGISLAGTIIGALKFCMKLVIACILGALIAAMLHNLPSVVNSLNSGSHSYGNNSSYYYSYNTSGHSV